MSRIKDNYNKAVVPALMKKFGYQNQMQVPRLDKVVINMGLGAAVQNIKIIDTAVAEMTALAGDTAAARRGLDEVLATVGWGRGGSSGVVGVRVGYAVALAAIALGDRELALSALERTRPRGPWLWSYLIFPGFDPLRGDPRFRAVYLEAKPAGAPDPP